MDHKMKTEDARAIAETLLASMDLRGFRTAFSKCRRSDSSEGEWIVTLDVFSPTGGLVDGGMLVVVDEQSRRARLFETL